MRSKTRSTFTGQFAFKPYGISFLNSFTFDLHILALFWRIKMEYLSFRICHDTCNYVWTSNHRQKQQWLKIKNKQNSQTPKSWLQRYNRWVCRIPCYSNRKINAIKNEQNLITTSGDVNVIVKFFKVIKITTKAAFSITLVLSLLTLSTNPE